MKTFGKKFMAATLGGGLLLTSSALGATLEQRVADLEEGLDAVELAATLNKVKFGLDFNTSVNNIFTESKAGGVTSKDNYTNRWMMGLYLNMNADINEYTKFTGRLSMTKAFGDLEWLYPANPIGTLDAGRGVSGGSAIYVERAYVDLYAFDKKVALTVGRLPGTDGPGSNLRNGSARMSTYPAMAVNALGDGVVLTLKPYTNAALRAGFSKVYQPLDMTGFSGAGSIFTNSKVNDANLFFGAFETPFLPKSFGENLFMVTYINLQDYTIPGTSLGLLASAATQQQLTASSQNAGNMQYVNVHAENNKMLGSGLSWFASYSWYNGYGAENLSAMTAGQNPQAVSLGKLLANESAWAVHAGLRYDIGSILKLGYEYFHGSEYWYAFSRASINDPFNFRNTRGNVHDVYAIFQVDMNQFFRLSYTLQQIDYATPLIPMKTGKVDQTNQNVALAYIVRF